MKPILILFLALAAGLSAIAVLGAPAKAPGAAAPAVSTPIALPESPLSKSERIAHALNRLAFGPRPGDVEAIAEEGLEGWIARQLNPETMDDHAVAERLSGMATLGRSPLELYTHYPPPPLVQGTARQLKRRLDWSDEKIAGYFPETADLLARDEEDLGETMRRRAEEAEAKREAMSPRERMRETMKGPRRLPVELAQAKLTRAVYSERQLEEVMTDFWFNHFNVFAGKSTARFWIADYEQNAIRPHALGRFRDLLHATAGHPAMLIYLDNWLSSDPDADIDPRDAMLLWAHQLDRHDLPPGGLTTLIARERGVDTSAYEKKVGRQLDRLKRAARMTGGRWPERGRPRENREIQQRQGLNENYARELLELHTLGVDGGYTQQDIVEVAKCFSGWTLTPTWAGQQFVYGELFHVPGKKKVLGETIREAGMNEGRQVLDMLAAHPSTARFISWKLARRFVADQPPAELVDSMAATFRATDGDIKSILRTMLESETFWSPEAYRAKVKTPFDFVAGALRASAAEVEGTSESGRVRPGGLAALRELGQVPYMAQPPTGYEDEAKLWVSTGALLQRLKIALGIATGRLPGIDPQPVRGNVYEIAERVLGVPASSSTLDAISQQLEAPPAEHAELGLPGRLPRDERERAHLTMGWVLASAEFQRR